jgi:mannose-1-phosphate guanylyltransferase
MVSVLKKTEEEMGIKISFSVETEPLGTGAHARDVLSELCANFFL